MRVGNLKHDEITKLLQDGKSNADKIRSLLKIDESTPFADLYASVRNDLNEMHIDIVDDDDDILFDNDRRQSIPSAFYSDFNCILINTIFPQPERLEALFHEYVHIKLDDELPAMEDIIDDKEKIYDLERLVDITNCTLIMPPEILKQNLSRYYDEESNSYRMNKILQLYKNFERCSVLQWITIHSKIACHFAWLIIYDDNKPPLIYESYYYDHENDPKIYPIDMVLKINSSAASKAKKKKRDAVERESHVGENTYQCYAYYEKDLNKAICTVQLEKTTFKYDRELVIGWKKAPHVIYVFEPSS
jgi:Zn-dependent peptidase ImmA (M78 family)